MSIVSARAWRAIVAASCLWAATAFAGPYDAWLYYRAVTVSNATPAPLAAFQVRLDVDTAALVGAGKLRADAGDLRFASLDLQTALPYFIESGINTANTIVWVRVPSIPASGNVDVAMVYGNPAAASASSGATTFDFYEDFAVDLGQFTNPCGVLSSPVVGGEAALSWASEGVLRSTTVFPLATVFTAEANVSGATGNWPGIHWLREGDQRGYGVLKGSTNAILSKTGPFTEFCQGHNFTSQAPFSSTSGLWSATWVATGDARVTFPSVGPLTTTDSEHARDDDLVLVFGGISSGTGSMNVDWIRVRKFAETAPGFTVGAELDVPLVAAPIEIPVPLLAPAMLALLAALLGLAATPTLRRRG